MTKVLLLSDEHNDRLNLNKILAQENDADVIIFLGDGLEDVKDALLMSQKPFHYVAGNCDVDAVAPLTKVIEIEKTKILITHGHIYDAKLTSKFIANAAIENGCSYAFVGHTHIQDDEIIKEIRVINPGAVSYFGNYAIVTIDSDDLKVEFCSLN